MTTIKDFKSYTDIEHVRARPDMYIGTINTEKNVRWIVDGKTIVKTEIEYNAGLEQCILEILTNAADHVLRCRTEKNVKQVKTIRVDVDDEKIEIYNDGQGIPLEKLDTGIYLPENIFGNLRTSSNYDDTKKKTWGGKNGIGAKAANIFSTRFLIEIQNEKKKYTQEFTNGMTVVSKPEITKVKTNQDYVKITYYPDFKAFGMSNFTSNYTKVLIEKRCYDVAGTISGIDVYFNGKLIPVKNFSDYMRMYIDNDKQVIYSVNNWEVGFAKNPFDDFTQISFVNSICTDDGGTHVKHVLDQVLTNITDKLQEKNKSVTIKKDYVKKNLIIFINSYIENPVFNGQLKRKLESKESDFGSKCVIDEKTIKKIEKLGITDNIIEIAKVYDMKVALKTIDSSKRVRLTDIKKLADANYAGVSGKSEKCTLILTEGDSAMSLALNGIGAAGGRDYWGVFPLKGKFINIRNAKPSQLISNEEIININKILGLKEGLKDIKKLRYGRVALMTDQDPDGNHIRGLLINYFTYRWPELVEQGLLQTIITPLVKIFDKRKVIHNFYSLEDYKKWSLENASKKYDVKYYKGLGTSNQNEAREYFSNLNDNLLHYVYNDKKHKNKLVLAFDKDSINGEKGEGSNDRKKWIKNAIENPKDIDYKIKNINIDDFIDNELVKFSIEDLSRSIPSIIDGLKPSNRKILYTCLINNTTKSIKVSELSGIVSKETAYHHGEKITP
jgi:DNA topoisomerase-2